MSRIQILDAAALLPELRDPRLVLLDARKAEAYRESHLAGARHLDPATLLLARTDAAAQADFVLRLERIFSALGIAPDSRVAVYGEGNEAGVARVAWALEFAGHAAIAVLDGGLAAAPGLPRTSEVPLHAGTSFKARPRPALLASASQIADLLHRPEALLLDARSRDDYEGRNSNAKRAGRIPGALFWDAGQEVDGAGRFAPPEALAATLRRSGIAPDRQLVVYCGSGGRASRTYLALARAGYPKVAVYPGSWSEWGNRGELPIESPRPGV